MNPLPHGPSQSGSGDPDRGVPSSLPAQAQQPAKHTPGPWSWTVSPFGQVEIRGAGSAFVARLRHMDGEFDTTVLTEQNKANARLIAAAPELLAALQGCETVWAKSNSADEFHARFALYLNEIRKAIAQATQPSPSHE